MMHRILPLLAFTALAGLPATAAPPEAAHALRPVIQASGAQLVYWHAGGITPGGAAWHAGGAGGYRWGGAYHAGAYPPAYYHGYAAAPYARYYRAPVVVAPYAPPVGTFAAGAMVGAAAASTAAASAQHYSQPPTVVNNYYYGAPPPR
jgi:hypothetical protein